MLHGLHGQESCKDMQTKPMSSEEETPESWYQSEKWTFALKAVACTKAKHRMKNIWRTLWWLLSYLILSVNSLSEECERRKRMNRLHKMLFMDTYMKLEVGYYVVVWQGSWFRQKHTNCTSPEHGLGLITLLLREGPTSILQQTNPFEIQELFILKGFEFPFNHTTEFTLQAAWRFSRYFFSLPCLSTILMATEFALLQSSFVGCRQEQPSQWLEGLGDAPFKAHMPHIVSTLVS